MQNGEPPWNAGIEAGEGVVLHDRKAEENPNNHVEETDEPEQVFGQGAGVRCCQRYHPVGSGELGTADRDGQGRHQQC